MEPQLEGCGKSRRHPQEARTGQASMEPQLEGCGKGTAVQRAANFIKLQWSRNLRVAESRGSTSASPRCRRFNGAAT